MKKKLKEDAAVDSPDADETGGATPWAAMSLDQRSRAVSKAIQARYSPLSTSGCYGGPWPDAIFDDYCIVRKGGGDDAMYRQDFTVAADGTVTLSGDPVPVRVAYVPIAESIFESPILFPLDDDGHLFESDAKPTGKQWGVIIIREGMSKNRNNYSRKTLEAAMPLYEGAKIYMDHQETPRKFGRSTRDVAGFLKNIHAVTLTTQEAVTGDAKGSFAIAATACITNPAVRETLLDAYEMGKPDLFGLSHDVAAESVAVMGGDGKAFYDVKRIANVDSVDFVTNPAAGGRVLRLVASNTPAETLEGDERMLTKMLEAIKAKRPDLMAALGENPTEDKVFEAYEKTMAAAPVVPATPVVPVVTPPVAPMQMTEAEVTQLREQAKATRQTIGQLRVDNALTAGNCGLPDVVKDKLRVSFTEAIGRGEDLTDERIGAAIKTEVEVWGKLAEAKLVLPAANMTRAQVVEGTQDKLNKFLDDFFDPKKSAQSFREGYITFTGDRQVTGRVNEAVRLLESIGSGTFSNILGDSITRRMVAEYTLSPLGLWKGTIANIVPVSDFRTQHRMRMGGYNNLPAVTQGSPYVALTTPSDEEATYAATKRGGTESITLEAIKNDDVGLLRRIPGKLARAAAQTQHEFVFDFMRANSAIYDSVALAASGHGTNISSTALSATQLKALRLAIKQQTDMSNSKRIGLIAKHLWVPGELEELAYQLTNADRALPDSSLTSTAMAAAKAFEGSLGLAYHVIDYWTDTNNYWVTCDVADVPMIEIGVLDGNENPDLFVQDLPNVGSMFTNDAITYKMRHIYGGAVEDFRGFAGGIVAGG